MVKLRVHELAKKLGLENKELIDKLGDGVPTSVRSRYQELAGKLG